MKKRTRPETKRTTITSVYDTKTGQVLIGVDRGTYATVGQVLYRLEPEKLAGAVEDRKELAVIVNNLGLLVLAQLTGFNLAESLDGFGAALAKWGHIDVKQLTESDTDDKVREAAALVIAQKTVHGKHGHRCGPDAPDFSKGETCECECECTGTPEQTVCATNGCDLCYGDDREHVQ